MKRDPLQQHDVGHGQRPDVVEGRGERDRGRGFGVADPLGDQVRVVGHAVDVRVGSPGAALDGARESPDRLRPAADGRFLRLRPLVERGAEDVRARAKGVLLEPGDPPEIAELLLVLPGHVGVVVRRRHREPQLRRRERCDEPAGSAELERPLDRLLVLDRSDDDRRRPLRIGGEQPQPVLADRAHVDQHEIRRAFAQLLQGVVDAGDDGSVVGEEVRGDLVQLVRERPVSDQAWSVASSARWWSQAADGEASCVLLDGVRTRMCGPPGTRTIPQSSAGSPVPEPPVKTRQGADRASTIRRRRTDYPPQTK